MSFESEKETYEMLGRYSVGFEEFCGAMLSCIRNLLYIQGLKNDQVQEILLAGMTADPLLSKLNSLVNAVIAKNEERVFKILCHLKSANALRLLAADPDRRTCSFGAEPTTRISSSMLS